MFQMKLPLLPSYYNEKKVGFLFKTNGKSCLSLHYKLQMIAALEKKPVDIVIIRWIMHLLIFSGISYSGIHSSKLSEDSI